MQPFRKILSSPLYLISLLEALLASGCYIAAAYISNPIEAPIYLMYEGGALHIGLMSLMFLVVGYLFDFYKHIRVRSRLVLVLQLLHMIGIIFLAHAAIAFISPESVAPHPIVILGNALALLVLVLWRFFLRPALWNAIGTQKVIFVGAGQAVDRLAAAFREDVTLGMEVKGYILDSVAGNVAPILGNYDQLAAVVSRVKPSRIIVGADDLRDNRVLKTLFDLRSAGLNVESAADAYETLFGRIHLGSIDPYTVIFRNELSARPGSVALQSIYTNVLALLAVILAVPLMTLIAILMKFTGRGPVLSKHVCIGLHGIPFTRFRFECSGGGALRRFLIQYRLEAVPQILNIVRGDMALIGPRAERAEFDKVIDDLIPFWRQKQSVKPGIVGWSQLHCDIRSTEDTLERVEYDLYYIKHLSLVLDAYILLRGLKWMLSERNAEPRLARLRDAAAQ
jgi:lipopolysaccharide/colanic/teichoic acid biosynthesis glycosyltransferase